ncbi:MAG: hypothetical protein AAF449_07145, partial [Myxococcota bacterium]
MTKTDYERYIKTDELFAASYIFPLLDTGLMDTEERVVARALRSITTLVELRLLSRRVILEKAKDTAPLLVHPGNWMRRAALFLHLSV